MKEQTIPQNARQDSEFSLCAADLEGVCQVQAGGVEVGGVAAVAPRVQENIPAPCIGIVLGAVFHIILMKATKTKVNLAETEEK